MRIANAMLIAAILGIAGCGSGSTPAKAYTNTDGYPLDVCVVSGQKLGSMGAPFLIKYEGKTVKLCCSACLKEFNQDSGKYMKILSEAGAKNTPAN